MRLVGVPTVPRQFFLLALIASNAGALLALPRMRVMRVRIVALPAVETLSAKMSSTLCLLGCDLLRRAAALIRSSRCARIEICFRCHNRVRCCVMFASLSAALLLFLKPDCLPATPAFLLLFCAARPLISCGACNKKILLNNYRNKSGVITVVSSGWPNPEGSLCQDPVLTA